MRHLIVPGIVAAFSLIVIRAALQLGLSPPIIVGHSMQPRAFPILLMVIALILSGVLAVQNRRSPPRKVELEGLPTWGSIALFAIFYPITVYVNLLIAIAVVMFFMGMLWGERRVHVACAVALITPAAIFLLFDTVLRVRFPRGLITNWYYG